MENRERLNVYFEMDGLSHLLFLVVNIGTKDSPDFKFSGFSDLYINYKSNDESDDNKGFLTEEEMDKSTFHDNIEFTYHNDGSFLSKNMDFQEKSKRYNNPYGTGVRWTPINEIHRIQPVISIAIRRMDIYHPKKVESEKEKVRNYICKNPDLFERSGQYLVAIYLKERNVPVACYTTAQGYSDILININDNLDLCILFQRHCYPKAEPYYTKYFGGVWITPYLSNSITFCNKETSIDEMTVKMKNVFDPAFSEFTKIMGDGQVVNFSESKLKIIDIVDKIYSPIKNGTNINKPLFIKHLLESIPDFDKFNAKSYQEKDDYVKTCYLMAWALPIMQTRSQDVEQILYNNDSDKQKIIRIINLLKDITA